MKLLVIGSGGREHALAWKLAQSPVVQEILIAPGNAGTASEPKCRNVAIAIHDQQALVDLARQQHITLTIVGPEMPLVDGIVDYFRSHGCAILGPTAQAAQLEGSKAFAKDFLRRHRIPTASYAVFTNVPDALTYVAQRPLPIVIKADGLAAGKGVVVATTAAQAQQAVTQLCQPTTTGASRPIVIEDFLDGEEVSFIALVDGTQFLPLATSQDHKRVGDGETGRNTGGMGAYSPAPVVTATVYARIIDTIIKPTLQGMAEDGMPLTGFLYAGLMIDRNGHPQVIEFNVRLGDPETQAILPRLRTDLVTLVNATVSGDLAKVHADWDPATSIAVVMAAQGYPDTPRLGDVIDGLTEITPTVHLFHAGTALNGQQRVTTAGGRVLSVCAMAKTMTQAQQRAYAGVKTIHWPGAFYRNDIGWRALHLEQRRTPFAADSAHLPHQPDDS